MGPKGLFVTEISHQEAINIYAVRAELEGLLVSQFAERADASAMMELDAAAQKLSGAFKSGEIDFVLATKAEFYEVLCAGAGNPVVLELLRKLNTCVNRLRFASLIRHRATQSIAEIGDLVETLKQRNAGRTRGRGGSHQCRG
jgi:DNA-binding GntR family transcriptional regulator